MQLIEQHIAGDRVLDTGQQLLENAKRGRRDAGRHAGMHALGEHAHPQRADQIAAQRGRAPHLIVVAALRVQAHHERGLPKGRAQGLEVRRQIVAAAFFAGLDQYQAARQAHLLLLQRGDRRERAEHRVAVVGGAAAVELALADHRLPGSQTRQPAGEFRLLVQMPVEQHAPRQLARHLDQQQRRPAGQAPHLHAHPGQRLPAAPLRHELYRRLHVSVAFPLRIEHQRLVGNAHVRDQPVDD